MMVLADGDLLPEDVALQKTVRDLARREIAPRAARLDRDGAFPADSVFDLARLGLWGLMVPAEYGGLSASRAQISLVIEEIARACGSTALTLMAHVHSSALIAAYAEEALRAEILPAVASGRHLTAVCLTEPEAGTDIASMRSVARREGDRYVINGRKTFITNGGMADLYVVFARMKDWTGEGPGVTAFVVNAQADGVGTSRPFEKMGLKASRTTDLLLDSVSVPASARLGEEGAGLQIAVASLDGARMSTAAQAVGLARGAFDLAFDYALERVQSGKAIAHHQAVQLRIAEMQVKLAAARALLYQTARAIDRGCEDAATRAAATKVCCTSTASEVTSQSVELLGGYGYMEEYQLSRYMRDAKGGEIYDGTNDVNRLMVARQLIKKATP